MTKEKQGERGGGGRYTWTSISKKISLILNTRIWQHHLLNHKQYKNQETSNIANQVLNKCAFMLYKAQSSEVSTSRSLKSKSKNKQADTKVLG